MLSESVRRPNGGAESAGRGCAFEDSVRHSKKVQKRILDYFCGRSKRHEGHGNWKEAKRLKLAKVGRLRFWFCCLYSARIVGTMQTNCKGYQVDLRE